MKLNDILTIVNKNKKFEKRKIIFTLILIFILIMLFLVVTCNHTIFNYIYNLYYKSYTTRNLRVNEIIKDSDLVKLKENKHILSIEKQNAASLSASIDEFGDFTIYPITKNNVPKVLSGVNTLEENNLICPQKFVPNFDDYFKSTTDSIIDEKDILNKEITLNVEKSDFVNHQKIVLDEKDYYFKITGLYDSEEYIMENDVCFVSQERFTDIYNFLYSRNGNDPEYHAEIIFVDNFKNVDSVINDFAALGYKAEKTFVLDYETISIYLLISIAIISSFMILIYIVINFNIKRELSDKENEILLYKIVGYRPKDILKIFYIEYIIICLISLVIAVLLSYLILFGLKILASKLVIFGLLKIKYGILEIVCLIIMGLIYPSILIIQKSKKILKKEKIDL